MQEGARGRASKTENADGPRHFCFLCRLVVVGVDQVARSGFFRFGGLAIGRTVRLGWFCWRKQSEEEHGEGEGFAW